MKRDFPGKSQQGFTLIEVIVALAIFGIIIVSFLPLQIYLTKAGAMNRMRMQAQHEVNFILEDLTAEVNRVITATQKGFDSGTELKPGRYDSEETRNNIKYSISKIIRWVDDPKDGTYGGTPNDINPFDYKAIDITVTATGPFGKPISKSFSAILARHGDDVPYTGILVEVQRATDNPTGHDRPVGGVYVNLSPVSSGATGATGITDDRGLALLSVDIPASYSDSEPCTYKVILGKGGYMMNPAQTRVSGGSAGNYVSVKRWRIEKSNIMEFEPAAHLKFTLKPNHLGAVIDVVTFDETISEIINTGVTCTDPHGRIETTDFWPLTDVAVTAQVTARSEHFDSGNYTIWQGTLLTGEPPVNIENLWQYQSGYYDASRINHQPNGGYHGNGFNRLVSPAIDLYSFRGGTQLVLQSLIISWNESMTPASVDPNFTYIYAGKGDPAADASSGWDPVRSVRAHTTDGLQTLSLDPSYVTSDFKLRFDSNTSMDYLRIDDIKLETRYQKSVSFSPGITRVIPITL